MEGSQSLGGCSMGDYILPLAPFPVSLSLFISASWQPQAEQLCSAVPFCHDVLSCLTPKAMERANHRLKFLKPPTKIYLSSFMLFFSGTRQNDKSILLYLIVTYLYE